MEHTNNDEDEKEVTPALNILSQMIAITTFLCFYISTLLNLKLFQSVKTLLQNDILAMIIYNKYIKINCDTTRYYKSSIRKVER